MGHSDDQREDLLALAAARVRAVMKSPEEIREGLARLTSEDLSDPRLAEIWRRAETLDPDAMSRVIWHSGIDN